MILITTIISSIMIISIITSIISRITNIMRARQVHWLPALSSALLILAYVVLLWSDSVVGGGIGLPGAKTNSKQ